MKKHLPENKDPYDNKTMKTKLFQTFGDEIIIATLDGKPVTIKTTASKILQKYHKNSSNLEEEDEKELLLNY